MAPLLSLNGVSPRFRALQVCQVTLAVTVFVFVFVALLSPTIRSRFLFSLLYSLVFSSLGTTILVNRELANKARGVMTADDVATSQFVKCGQAAIMYLVGFVIFVKTPYEPGASKSIWVDELLRGFHPLHTTVLVAHALNWVLLLTGTIYSCVGVHKRGQIRLDDDAQIPLDSDDDYESTDGEAIARDLQGQEPGGQADGSPTGDA